ncbi:MAG: Glucokinase [Crocinitomicaceae bacterium]|jgi:glucokinase|nr:Glucokinase [Crocinitomicaceae bacterium]
MDKIALGVDIGGTNTAYGLVDHKGKILVEDSAPTRQFASARDLAGFLYDFVQKNCDIDHLVGIGIGAPNGNQFTGTIDFAPNLHWKGVIPMVEIFEKKFNKKALLSNDANAAAIGEKLFGNAKDLTDFVEITLGTGLGSGIISDNELLFGKHGIAGEYGHIRVIPNGRLCGCGRKGCLETYVSSTGVVRSIRELNSVNKQSSKLADLSEPSAKKVFELALEGDVFAREIVDYTAEILGSSLADFAAFSDPEAFILFGGLSLSGSYFTDKVKKAMDANLLNIYQHKIEIRVSALNELNAAILGASAAIFWNTLKFNFNETH